MFSRLTAGSGDSRKQKERALEEQIEQLKAEAERAERESTYVSYAEGKRRLRRGVAEGRRRLRRGVSHLCPPRSPHTSTHTRARREFTQSALQNIEFFHTYKRQELIRIFLAYAKIQKVRAALRRRAGLVLRLPPRACSHKRWPFSCRRRLPRPICGSGSASRRRLPSRPIGSRAIQLFDSVGLLARAAARGRSRGQRRDWFGRWSEGWGGMVTLQRVRGGEI